MLAQDESSLIKIKIYLDV